MALLGRLFVDGLERPSYKIMANNPSEPKPQEDRVLTSARREAIVVFVVWALALTYTVSVCYFYGYGRDPKSLKFVLGFPDWVFWGIIVPWAVCIVFSLYFGARFVRDEKLEEEPAETPVAPSKSEGSEEMTNVEGRTSKE
ncbi:MAG: DUF997 family protein [Planctomycetia bacterium]|nr:DUF997 family protein [Planctomycetia bacterium]